MSDAEARVYVQAVDSKGRAVNNYEGEVTISVVTIEAKTPGLKSAKTSITSKSKYNNM